MVNRGVGGASFVMCGSFGNSDWGPEKKDVPVNDWSLVLYPPSLKISFPATYYPGIIFIMKESGSVDPVVVKG